MPAHTPCGSRFSERKGENYELRSQLNSQYSRKRKEAVKKVIANMTLGNDVSSLFADVVKNMQTDDLELKRLVYLYLSTHARSKPSLVVLAVNTFVKDSQNPEPLIRALAIRTMGMLRVEKITTYLIDTLKRSVSDSHPYVRKTVALCIAKVILFQPNDDSADSLVSCLQEMLNDKSSAVVSNAAAALSEISVIDKYKDCLTITDHSLVNLVKMLSGSSEWGQMAIISALENYNPNSYTKASNLCESIIPRLQHDNPGIGLAAVRLLIKMINYLGKNTKLIKTIYAKIAKFLVTSINSSPEIQFVILKNMGLILQMCPEIKITSPQSFFVSYKDPLYLKFEKLNILTTIAEEPDCSILLNEFQEYTKEVEPQFVNKSIQAIGQLAIKIPSCSDKCVEVLMNYAMSDQESISQDSITVLMDVYRKYGPRYSHLLPNMFDNIGVLERSDAISSVIWFIGQYYDMIPQSYKLLSDAIGYANEFDASVHLRLLHTLSILFINRNANINKLFKKLIDILINETQDPDIRDRAHIYSRLTSEGEELSRSIILTEKPPFQINTKILPRSVLMYLIKYVGSLYVLNWDNVDYKHMIINYGQENSQESIADEDFTYTETTPDTNNLVKNTDLEDIFGTGNDAPKSDYILRLKPSPFDDKLVHSENDYGLPNYVCGKTVDNDSNHVTDYNSNADSPGNSNITIDSHPWEVSDFTTLLSSNECNGLSIKAKFNGSAILLFIANYSDHDMKNFAIQFNVNALGLVPESDINISEPLEAGKCVLTSVPVSTSDEVHPEEGSKLQLAFKNNYGIYFSIIDLPSSIR